MQVLGPIDALNIVRIQLALMPPGSSDIKLHVDSGGYAKHGHRIHIPIITHPHVSLEVCPRPAAEAPTAKGTAAAKTVQVPAEVHATFEPAVEAADHSSSNSNGGGVDVSKLPPTSRTRWWWDVASTQNAQQQGQGNRAQHSHDSQQCVNIPAPEGLVFELNNRIQHKVANPGPGPRVHLVIDVFEQPKARTTVPPGSVCEYGAQDSAVQQLQQVMEMAAKQPISEQQLAKDIEIVVASAGMSCMTPDNERIKPKLSHVDPDAAAERAQKQQELLQLLANGIAQQQDGQQPEGMAVAY